MADARPLFYVTAFVIAGLVAWVVSVWMRPGVPWAEAPKGPGAGPSAGPDAPSPPIDAPPKGETALKDDEA